MLSENIDFELTSQSIGYSDKAVYPRPRHRRRDKVSVAMIYLVGFLR